ncbi:MAG: hypothetical protein SGBAC_010736 [Bacillariaceae sp.]
MRPMRQSKFHILAYLFLCTTISIQSYFYHARDLATVDSCNGSVGYQLHSIPSLRDYSRQSSPVSGSGGSTTSDHQLDLNYCVIQITSPQGFIERSSANFRPTSKEFTQFHVYVNKYNKIVGTLNFDALQSTFVEEHKCSIETSDWVFIGDDDTLFHEHGIQAFMQARTKQLNKLYAHGNFFNPRKPYDKGWYNGGTGIAITGKVARLLLTNTTENNFDLQGTVQQEEEDCHCGDVPFARVLQYFRVRTIHQPNLFLDSCLDCNRMEADLAPVVACHGAELFRGANPQANDKARNMKDLYSNYFSEIEVKEFGAYQQPPTFANMSLFERRDYMDQICSRT